MFMIKCIIGDDLKCFPFHWDDTSYNPRTVMSAIMPQKFSLLDAAGRRKK